MDRQLTINWEGALFVHHSLAMVNRELLICLCGDARFSIRRVSFGRDIFGIESSPRFSPLTPILDSPHENPDVYIRHRWPPDFCRPRCKRFICIQPWEYGSLPSAWVGQIDAAVDEIWVPSQFVRDCYIQSGVPASKVFVVPNGIDPGLFKPRQPKADWIAREANKRFCFLYNGGVTVRKGADILANAYLNEFGPDEQVCLAIKDAQVYGKGLAGQIIEITKRSCAAKIIYSADEMSPEALPGMYAAADCYVQPYRGEGYGLPLAEAAACDLPVVATGGGACIDFLDESDTYFVNFTVEHMSACAVDDMPTVTNPFWLLPDTAHVQKLMRHVYEHRGEARERGVRLGAKIRRNHTWTRAAQILSERLFATSGSIGSPGNVSSISETRIDANFLENGMAAYRRGDLNEAARLFRRSLVFENNRSASYKALGLIALAQNRHSDASEYFNIAEVNCAEIAEI